MQSHNITSKHKHYDSIEDDVPRARENKKKRNVSQRLCTWQTKDRMHCPVRDSKRTHMWSVSSGRLSMLCGCCACVRAEPRRCLVGVQRFSGSYFIFILFFLFGAQTVDSSLVAESTAVINAHVKWLWGVRDYTYCHFCLLYMCPNNPFDAQA